jgi:hypothetical protein
MMPNPLSSLSFMPQPGVTPGGYNTPLNINNSFGGDGSLSTTLPMRGVDIGPAPDFWGDLQKMMALKKPAAPRPVGAGRSVSRSTPSRSSGPSESGARTPQRHAMGSGYYSFPGNSTGGVLNMLKPGGPRPAGAHIFSTGAQG